MDKESKIKGSVKAWRAAFPDAREVNISYRNDLCAYSWRCACAAAYCGKCHRIIDAAFVHLRGIHTLHMGYCSQTTITDAAFVHLRGIHTLDMWNCDQKTITDAAFVHLRGIHTLCIFGCNQATITDSAFIHLRGIHTLVVCGCNQITITPAALIHLRGIHTLRTDGGSPASHRLQSAAAALLEESSSYSA